LESEEEKARQNPYTEKSNHKKKGRAVRRGPELSVQGKPPRRTEKKSGPKFRKSKKEGKENLRQISGTGKKGKKNGQHQFTLSQNKKKC